MIPPEIVLGNRCLQNLETSTFEQLNCFFQRQVRKVASARIPVALTDLEGGLHHPAVNQGIKASSHNIIELGTRHMQQSPARPDPAIPILIAKL